VQDDDEDKGPEKAKMAHIYRNAILNVGAIAAADSESDENPDLYSVSMAQDTFVGDADLCTAPNPTFNIRPGSVDTSSTTTLVSAESTFATGSNQYLVSTGLFVDRDPQQISPFALTVKRKDYEKTTNICVLHTWTIHGLFKSVLSSGADGCYKSVY
jgi:hypothetical protein